MMPRAVNSFVRRDSINCFRRRNNKRESPPRPANAIAEGSGTGFNTKPASTAHADVVKQRFGSQGARNGRQNGHHFRHIYPRFNELRCLEPEKPISAGFGDKYGIGAGRIIKPDQQV